jgi:uncharacterized protein (TIGR02996 family)
MPTPAEELAFLKPIRARFRDDVPRLVYADYLDESLDSADQDRAEFIRLQLALARIPHDHPHRGQLADRQNELLLLRHDEWTQHLRGLADGFEFRRGMIDSVTVNVGTFAAKGEQLFRLAPIRRVRFSDAGCMIAKLVNVPLLAEVRELVLCDGGLENGGVNVLLRSQYLGKLRALDLSFNGLCDGGVWLLAESRALPRLTRLYMNDNQRITADGLKRLANSLHFGGLRVLDVSANDIGDAGMTALADSRILNRLHTLRIRANHIGDAGCESLARSPLLARLLARNPHLELRQNTINSAGAKALAASPHLSAAATLDLSENYLKDDGLTALVESHHTANLSSLLLRTNQLTDIGVVELARSPLMKRLALVDVSSNKLTRRGIDELWKRRRNWQTVIHCEGNVPGVSGPSERVRSDRTELRG